MKITEMMEKLDQHNNRDLKTYIDDVLETEEEVPPFSKTDFIRVSSIYNFCPRMEAIRVNNDITLKNKLGASLRKIFAHGRAFEKSFRDKALGDLGVVIGKWKCLECGYVPEKDVCGSPRYPKPKTCPKCNARGDWSYQEEEVFDTSCMIKGHCDGFVYWNNDYAILECKTANDNRFKDMKKKGPSIEYLAQVQVYMKKFNYKKGLIWIFNKNNGDDVAFWIDYDSKFASLMENKGYELKNFFENGKMPDRICINCDCDRAKTCPVKELCFPPDTLGEK